MSYRHRRWTGGSPKSEPCAQNARRSVQSLNPLLKMQAGASKVWTLCLKCTLERPKSGTLCSKCKRARPKSEPCAQNAGWRSQSLGLCAQNASWSAKSLNPLLKMQLPPRVSNPVLKAAMIFCHCLTQKVLPSSFDKKVAIFKETLIKKTIRKIGSKFYNFSIGILVCIFGAQSLNPVF